MNCRRCHHTRYAHQRERKPACCAVCSCRKYTRNIFRRRLDNHATSRI